jgi:tetratricopeptide (TPR) repeat protein
MGNFFMKGIFFLKTGEIIEGNDFFLVHGFTQPLGINIGFERFFVKFITVFYCLLLFYAILHLVKKQNLPSNTDIKKYSFGVKWRKGDDDMKINKFIICILFVFLSVFLISCNQKPQEKGSQNQEEKIIQAVSRLGKNLYAPEPAADAVEKYNEAKAKFENSPDNPEALIWYGRQTAYLGKYREAIAIYTDGIAKFPEDARLYRHRGHRYISVREFEKAIADFEKAAALIAGTEDTIEPDGMPNEQNIPVSSLHTNIWYHLGLAYYLENDLENALRVYREGIAASQNDDMLVATTHWLYMTLRLLGKDEEAGLALEPIQIEMNVIENKVYHKLCLFYKEELSLDELTDPEFSNVMNDALAYGIGNWHFYNGERDKAKEIFQKILEGESWASFGFIAAESDFARNFQ